MQGAGVDAEVAAATKDCKIFGKLYRAIKLGMIDTKDKDLKPFQGVFDSLYIVYTYCMYSMHVCYHDVRIPIVGHSPYRIHHFPSHIERVQISCHSSCWDSFALDVYRNLVSHTLRTA